MTDEAPPAPTVVICGSMRAHGLMSRIGEFLENAGLSVVVPAPDDPSVSSDAERSAAMKRDAARRHMKHIRHSRTVAVLVVNVDRPDVRHYIGPNSFAEIGVAFADDRQVFLLQGMPESYAEELTAWGVTCLERDVRPLLDAVSAEPGIDPAAWEKTLREEELVC